MRNQPRIVETPIAVTIPIDPAMAALCVSSVICANGIQSLKWVETARLSYVRAGVEPCKGVLSHEYANHNDISFARADTPTRIPRVVQKLGEHKST